MKLSQGKSLPFLDCTFRDGGYYTNWEFNEDLRSRLLSLDDSAGISHVELGFRFLREGPFGPFAFTSEKFLATLDLPKSPSLGVMINAEEYLGDPTSNVRRAFRVASESKLSFVRIASHIAHLDRIDALVGAVRDMGYQVHLNLMQASHSAAHDIGKLAKIAQDYSLDFVYLADSLGSMQFSDFAWRFALMKDEGVARTGVHAHNNRAQATETSVQLLHENLVDIADVTLRGIGRGAGNAVLEDALLLFDQVAVAGSFLDLSNEHLGNLQNQLGWGPSTVYLASALNEVHPSYPQEWREGGSLSDGEIVQLAPSIGGLGGNAYEETSEWSGKWLLEASTPKQPTDKRSGNPSLELLKLKSKALIVGTGSTVLTYRESLELMSQDDQMQVVFLNIKSVIPQLTVDPLIATCNPLRFFLDYHDTMASEARVFAPLSQFKFLPPQLKQSADNSRLADVPIHIDPSKRVSFIGETVTVPFASSFAYSVGVCLLAGIKDIKIAGIDGYFASDPRKSKMSSLMADLAKDPALSLVSLTPTNYPIRVDGRTG